MPSFFSTWIPFLYLYLVGGLFFAVGLLIIIKSGALNKNNPRHRRWLKIMVCGYFFFLILHFSLIIAALYL